MLDRDPLEALCFAHEFIEEIQKATSLETVERLLEAVAHYMGFRHYAMIHHADARDRAPGLIHMQNYPDGFAERYVAEQLHRDDPVVHACLASSACFCWSEIPRLIKLNPRHCRFLEAGARAGVDNGITVPAYVLGERSGSCNFSGPRAPACVRRYVGVAQLIGSFSFQAARRILLKGRLRDVRAARLRPRQRECVVLVGHGKTNSEIAQILGIGLATVKTYLLQAMGIYDVLTRTQLVVAAVLDGEVGMHEVNPSQYLYLVD
ncbi:hypothetical protein ATE68_01435 [Sphingopyxis sp. H038]|uniref:LuxR family transcriptional regulator n=1 Tax=unclassified Sphingopyxis TaxID=2614943 RepID=UPI000730F85B|nr:MULTISPECIES: LuxR family transcriptional regulator [unclassified Sphingopyxis]KTE04340.1 hypothetical protein ATE78_01435 [Sphingopyxis sp. H012]KTE10820.1 hypothetical protein ATE76_12905 [Sphingopyxis sp. H093]KTE13459.1 hypothetical protein ATE70_01990 [Sphingopyxis sp. H053]KTE31298.1 hypothetical protein ATE75_01960 [Sphingopyxis sp. H080]KTE36830.1 hypothetical protein ATE68_01435 [Sphingopyxis sp. H038]